MTKEARVLKIYVGANDSDELYALARISRKEGFNILYSPDEVYEYIDDVDEVRIRGGLIEDCVSRVVLATLERGKKPIVEIENCRTKSEAIACTKETRSSNKREDIDVRVEKLRTSMGSDFGRVTIRYLL